MINNISFGAAFIQAGTAKTGSVSNSKTHPVFVNREDIAGIAPSGYGTDIYLKNVHITGGCNNTTYTEKAALHVQEDPTEVAKNLYLTS